MRVLYRVPSSASTFKFQYCVSSLNLFSNCLRFFLVFSSLLSLLQYTIINPVFLCYGTRRAFLLPSLYKILLYFSHNRSKGSALSFPSTILKNFQTISNLFSKASIFQYHKKVCSECSISLVSFLCLSTFCC
jgi:hypothetical protein